MFVEIASQSAAIGSEFRLEGRLSSRNQNYVFEEHLIALDVDIFAPDEMMPEESYLDCVDDLHASIPDLWSESAACAVSRDFVILGNQDATSILRQSLEDPFQATFLVNHFSPTRPFEDFLVSLGTQKVFSEPNAGGNSVNSEAISFEVIYRLYGARLLKTEMAIGYYHPNWKKTDYTVQLFGHHVGVSVTRAMKHRGEFSVEDGETLMQKKLNGVNISSRGVVRADRWEKQVLHVWAQNNETAAILHQVYMRLQPALRSNTIVIVTVSPNTPYLFKNCDERPRMLSSG